MFQSRASRHRRWVLFFVDFGFTRTPRHCIPSPSTSLSLRFGPRMTNLHGALLPISTVAIRRKFLPIRHPRPAKWRVGDPCLGLSETRVLMKNISCGIRSQLPAHKKGGAALPLRLTIQSPERPTSAAIAARGCACCHPCRVRLRLGRRRRLLRHGSLLCRRLLGQRGCSTSSFFGVTGISSGSDSSFRPVSPVSFVSTVMRTVPPFFSLPNNTSSASGFLMCSWMTRPSGRAPMRSS